MNTRTLILVTLALVLMSGTAASQTVSNETQSKYFIGPEGGINLVAYNTDYFPIIYSDPYRYGAENGSDASFWFGMQCAYPIGDHASNKNFLVAELLYDSRSSKFTSMNAGGSVPTVVNGVTERGFTSASMSANLAYVLLNISYQGNLLSGEMPVGPGLRIGPTVGIPVVHSLHKNVELLTYGVEPPVPEVRSTRSFTDAIPEVRPISLSLRGAITYDIPLFSALNAEAIVGYDYPLTKVSRLYNWTASSLFGGVSLRYVIHER